MVRAAAPLAALLLAACAAAGTPAGSAATTSPEATGTVATEPVRACRASDVRVTTAADGATGVTLRIVRLVARPGVRCLLGGYPQARVVTDGARVPVRRDPFVPGGGRAEPFLLERGRPGVVQLGWRIGRWCAPPVVVDSVELTMPGGGTVAAQGFGRAHCDTATFPGVRTGPPVSVSRFLPEG